MDKIKVIQAGVGSWGMSWIEKILGSKSVELAALVDVDSALLGAAAAKYNVDKSKCFASVKDAAKTIAADAAFVIVPPHLHKAVVLEALENNLHCLVEKPLAENIADSKIMVEAALKLEKNLMVSQNYRFKRAPQTVKSVLNRGLIGEVGCVYVNFQKDPPFTGFRTEMAEPLITDMAIHHFDQIRGILGLNPVSVHAKSWNPKWSRFKGNACVNVTFEMENGTMVVYNGSWVSSGWQTTWDGDWRIQGHDGEIHWSNNQVVLNPKDLFVSVFQDGGIEKDGSIHFDLLQMEQEERMAVIDEFALSIQEKREPKTSGADNLYSLAMVIGAKYSAKTGGTVQIEDVLNPVFHEKFAALE